MGGVGTRCIQWAMEQSGHVRIDTHVDNTVMQSLLLKLGFVRCGIIHVQEDPDPRIAYEWQEGGKELADSIQQSRDRVEIMKHYEGVQKA